MPGKRPSGLTYRPHQNCRPRGRWVDARGYVQVALGGSSRQIGEHTLIGMLAIGRELLPNEMVHHIDGNRQNNDPENLKVVTRSEHAKIHRLGGTG